MGETHKRPLEEEESLQRKAEEHVSDYFATLRNVGGEGNGAHSSPLAWKIPWMEEPGGLQSVRSLRVK